MIFLEADLSQVESRIVYMLTGDPQLRKLACLRSDEYDQHTSNAALVLNTTEDALRKDPDYKKKRHLGKIVSHGAQRDMHGPTLSNNILKELGILVSPERCDEYIARYHQRYPAIKDYFREIRRLVMRDRMLVSSWGQRVDFRYDRLDDELFRQAYGFLPPAEGAGLLNQWGLIPTYQWMKTHVNRPPNVQVHDSLLCSIEPEHAYDLASFIQKSLERPRMYGGELMTVFVEFKLGRTWQGDREFKRLPSRKEFTAVAYELNDA